MHKRIQELINQMDQAGLPYGDNAMTVTDRDLEYFAELIVKECATIVFNSHPEDLPFVGGKMLVHFGFGVKE